MSTWVTLIGDALDVLGVDPPDSFHWLGQRFRIEDHDERGSLTAHLTEVLYADLYCTGGPSPPTYRAGGIRDPPVTADVERLQEANRGTGSRDSGWVVTAIDDAGTLVSRSGLTLRARRADLLAGPNGPTVGDTVSVILPSGSRGVPHGFSTAYGDAGERDSSGGLDRFYWNVRPEGRERLLALVTTIVNRAGLPFRFKVLNDPDERRCDAAVLYTASADRPAVISSLREILSGVDGLLRGRTPFLTKRLAPGLGFAEDPPGDDSFGTHRCRLLVEAVVQVDGSGRLPRPDRLGAVVSHLTRSGVRIERPHLNQDTDVSADPEPIVP